MRFVYAPAFKRSSGLPWHLTSQGTLGCSNACTARACTQPWCLTHTHTHTHTHAHTRTHTRTHTHAQNIYTHILPYIIAIVTPIYVLACDRAPTSAMCNVSHTPCYVSVVSFAVATIALLAGVCDGWCWIARIYYTSVAPPFTLSLLCSYN